MTTFIMLKFKELSSQDIQRGIEELKTTHLKISSILRTRKGASCSRMEMTMP